MSLERGKEERDVPGRRIRWESKSRRSRASSVGIEEGKSARVSRLDEDPKKKQSWTYEDDPLLPGSRRRPNLLLSLEPSSLDGLANLDSECRLGLSEELGRVLESEVGTVLSPPETIVGQLKLSKKRSSKRRRRERGTHLRTVLLGESPDDLGVISGELEGLLLGVPEDDGSEERRGSVVEMHDDVLSSGDGGEGSLDEILSSRSEDLENIKTYMKSATRSSKFQRW